MDTGKPTKTLADYLVIAVSPALIIVLVHSLGFFLVEVFYRGEGAGGVRWVLFWFVVAVVLIARIGIEQGTGQAMGYGLVLAGATWVYLAFMQANVLFGAILLGVVWFTAHKITCNCTLVDDEADASGQGLMQSLRRLPSLFKKGRTGDSPVPSGGAPSGAGGSPAPPISPIRGQNVATRRVSTDSAPAAKKAKSSGAQVPGIWLLYYSLAALLLFGLGQTLLPAGDVAARHRGFGYLFFYLAAALGLLITTSFLGLRRYLRQRYLVMPDNLAFGWIQYGVVGAGLVLCLALLLPRPGAGEAWGALRYQVDHQLCRASEYAARFNPHGTGSGRAGTQAPPNGPREKNPPPSGPASNPKPDQNRNPGANAQGNQPAGAATSNPGTPEGEAGGENPGKNVPNLSPSANSLYPWLRNLFYLAAVIGVGGWLYRYRVVILSMFQSIWTAIRNFVAMLLGLFRSSATLLPAGSKTREVRPFKLFKNPFLTGGDRVWSAEQLIVYSYEALQSWAVEQEAPRGSPQTPREFCRQLGVEMPEAATALEQLAFLYGHVAYGASVPNNFNREQLRSLWNLMSSPRPKSSGVDMGDTSVTA